MGDVHLAEVARNAADGLCCGATSQSWTELVEDATCRACLLVAIAKTHAAHERMLCRLAQLDKLCEPAVIRRRK
jgi:hypothetical protein